MTLATLIGHVTPLATSFFLPLVSLFGASATFANSVTSSHLSIWQNIVPSYLPPCTPIPLQTTSNLDKKKHFQKLNSEVGQSKGNQSNIEAKIPTNMRLFAFCENPVWKFIRDNNSNFDCISFHLTFKLRDRKLKAWHRKGWSSRDVHKFLGIFLVCLLRSKHAHKCLEIL